MHTMRRPAQKRKASALSEPEAAGAGGETDAVADEPAAGPAGPVHPGRHGRKRSLAELQGAADGLRSGKGKGALAGALHQSPQHVRKPYMVSCRTYCRFQCPSEQKFVQADHEFISHKLNCRCSHSSKDGVLYIHPISDYCGNLPPVSMQWMSCPQLVCRAKVASERVQSYQGAQTACKAD